MRRLAVFLVVLVGLVAGSRWAVADDAMWRTFRGRVMFSDVALAPAFNFDSSATMTSALRRLERTSVDESSAGFWRLHMLAFLDRPAATDVLVLRAYDTSVPRERRASAIEPKQVRVFEVPVERGAREVRLDDFVVTEAMGFERGTSYEVSLEAPPEEGGNPLAGTKKTGKADVYAKGVITLR